MTRSPDEMSPELRVMLSPASAYRALTPHAAGVTLRMALARPLLVAVVIGCALAIGATGRITFGLSLSTLLCWSFVPALQLLTGAGVMARHPGSPGIAGRIDLWFMGHAPWSLWLLAAAAILTAAGDTTRIEWLVVASALIPAVWTGIITCAFFQVVQRAPRRSAVRMAFAHQSVTVALVIGYLFLVARPWARVIGWVQP